MSSYEKLIASRVRTTKHLGSCKSGTRTSSSRFGSGSYTEKNHHVESGSSRSMIKSKKASALPIVKQTSNGFCMENAGYIRWHAWNPNQSMTVAINSSKPRPTSIMIYSISENKDKQGDFEWNLLHVLDGFHDRPVVCFDWSSNQAVQDNTSPTMRNQDEKKLQEQTATTTNGRIVSCGEDCRVFVWSYVHNEHSQQWTALQVLLEQQSICFTALQCKWNNKGNRIALAMSGNHQTSSVAICDYEEDSGEWIATTIGKREIKSSLLCVDWHPHFDDIVAVGGCDYCCRVFSVAREEELMQDELTNRIPKWAKKHREQCFEFVTNEQSWVLSVSFSPSGNTLAYSSQDSSIYVVDLSTTRTTSSNTYSTISHNEGEVPSIMVVKIENRLPMCSVKCFTDSMILAGGFDGTPTVIHHDDSMWSVKEDFKLKSSKHYGCDESEEGGRRGKRNQSMILCMQQSSLILDGMSMNQSGTIQLSTSGSGGNLHIWGASLY